MREVSRLPNLDVQGIFTHFSIADEADKTYTRRQDIITLEGAYHGNTNLLIDVSPYKHNGPGGTGARVPLLAARASHEKSHCQRKGGRRSEEVQHGSSCRNRSAGPAAL